MFYYIVTEKTDDQTLFKHNAFKLVSTKLDISTYRETLYRAIEDNLGGPSEEFSDEFDEEYGEEGPSIYPLMTDGDEFVMIDDREELERTVVVKEISEMEFNLLEKAIGREFGHPLFS